MAGENAAIAAQLVGGDFVLGFAFGAILLFHLPFDGKTMTVPAGHIGRVLAQHALGADHEVLQDVIEPGAGMNIAIGVDRPVMEDEKRAPARLLAHLAVEVKAFQRASHLGSASGSPAFMGKSVAGRNRLAR